ncbi:hypothetical protein TPSD3_03025 [Thioflexithrix psekupsensis]|uniref:Uncharacterized protein n=1 Tax=Thioflexithrix psekupsensis TaxID=1570016 RepID=A0A251XAX2_9GAMM|nr:hypothetical protein TPSD3_03025 [Thioflexithrix psekupsensis]
MKHIINSLVVFWHFTEKWIVEKWTTVQMSNKPLFYSKFRPYSKKQMSIFNFYFKMRTID